jgi:hypothetical protein
MNDTAVPTFIEIEYDPDCTPQQFAEVLASLDRWSVRTQGHVTHVRKYERHVYRAMQLYWEMVEGFYTRSFIEVFFEPRNKFNLPSAVTALLAGELDGGWRVYWRMRLFFWIVKIHSRWPILPKICFDDPPNKPPAVQFVHPSSGQVVEQAAE